MTLTSRSLSKGSSKNENPVWITGADALMDSLKIHGVKVIFGYPGGAILPIYDAVHKAEHDGWLKHYMVRQWQESFYDERYSSSDMSCGEPDFVKLAESFGVKGYLISDRKQLQNELKNALDHDGPALINILVRRGENCYPMVPPGKSNAQMVGYVNCED